MTDNYDKYIEDYSNFSNFLLDYGEQISSEVYDQNRRWVTSYEYIYKYKDKYYQFCRDCGSTEYQENEDPSEAIEVVPVKKMVEITEYVPVNKGE